MVSNQQTKKKRGLVWLITGILTLSGFIWIAQLNKDDDSVGSVANGCLSIIISGVMLSILIAAIFVTIATKKKNTTSNFPYEIPINAPSCKCDSPKLVWLYKPGHYAEVV